MPILYFFHKSVTFLWGKNSKCTSLIMNGFYTRYWPGKNTELCTECICLDGGEPAIDLSCKLLMIIKFNFLECKNIRFMPKLNKKPIFLIVLVVLFSTKSKQFICTPWLVHGGLSLKSGLSVYVTGLVV